MKIGLIGQGKLFGETDAIQEQPYSTTIKCCSTTGTWLKINSKILIKTIKETDHSAIANIKSNRDNNLNLNRYLEKNKTFEDSSKFMYKFKNFGDKLEDMEEQKFNSRQIQFKNPIFKKINERYQKECQSHDNSKDDTSFPSQKRIPYIQVKPLEIKEKEEIKKPKISGKQIIQLKESEILWKVI